MEKGLRVKVRKRVNVEGGEKGVRVTGGKRG